MDIRWNTLLNGFLVRAVLWAAIAALSGPVGLKAAEIEAEVRLAVPGLANSAPSLAAQGKTVVVVWAAAGKDGVTNVYAAKSADGGATFSQPRRVNDQNGDANINGEQAPRVAITGSPASPVVTVIWPSKKSGNAAIRMARSVDGGKSFSPAATLHAPTLHGARGWQSLTAAPDGTLHAVWLDGRDAERMEQREAEHRHQAEMQPDKSSKPAMDMTSMKAAPRQDVYQAVWTVDGRVVEKRVATDVCFCCKTAVAVGTRGTVYAAWRHIYPGSIRDIAFAVSRDGGMTFAPSVRVSEDQWEINGCPEDGPTLAVDATGTVHIVWPTLVSDGEQQKALFYSSSRDGRTFSARLRVPTSGITNPSHPQLAISSRGEMAIVWDEAPDGSRRVSMSRTPVQSAGPAHLGSPQVLSSADSARYPVVAAVDNGFVVAWVRGKPDEAVIAVKRVSLTAARPSGD